MTKSPLYLIICSLRALPPLLFTEILDLRERGSSFVCIQHLVKSLQLPPQVQRRPRTVIRSAPSPPPSNQMHRIFPPRTELQQVQLVPAAVSLRRLQGGAAVGVCRLAATFLVELLLRSSVLRCSCQANTHCLKARARECSSVFLRGHVMNRLASTGCRPAFDP